MTQSHSQPTVEFDPQPQEENPGRVAWIAAYIAISLATVGYFVGLQAPMPDYSSDVEDNLDIAVGQLEHPGSGPSAEPVGNGGIDSDRPVIQATAYRDMAAITRQLRKPSISSLEPLRSQMDPLQELTISSGEKRFALQLRAQNRAFNGAPPTIPHPIDPVSAASCMACHGEGFRTSTLRAAKMSHPYLENCTQCHVESNPVYAEPFEFRESSFVGLPAPEGGPRAYPDAPPQIPHSTWMRVECTSCHGVTGVKGIRTTHPWQQNCQQCHAPAASLEQLPFETQPGFLAPIQFNQIPSDSP